MLQFVKKWIAYSTIAICGLGISASAIAQMNIEITGVGQSLYPIAVMRFQDENKLPTRLLKSFAKIYYAVVTLKILRTVMLPRTPTGRQTINLGRHVEPML